MLWKQTAVCILAISICWISISWGNLNTDTLAQIDARRKEIGFIEQSCAVDEKCKICKWYQLCRGGCRRDRDYYQDGIGRNYYCAAYERFFEYAWPKLGEVYEEVIRG